MVPDGKNSANLCGIHAQQSQVRVPRGASRARLVKSDPMLHAFPCAGRDPGGGMLARVNLPLMADGSLDIGRCSRATAGNSVQKLRPREMTGLLFQLLSRQPHRSIASN